MKPGRGFSYAHHGEILQGAFRSERGSLRQGLISLPCDIFWSEAFFWPDASGAVSVCPSDKWKTRRAAEVALRRLGMKNIGGTVDVRSRIPEKMGLGSSTSNVAAAIRAVGDAFGTKFSSEDIAAIAVEAEGASDPLFFGNRFVLFAQREGRIIRALPRSVPDIEILGFNLSPRGGGIDTLALTLPAYTLGEIEAFEELSRLFALGLEREDLAMIAEVATRSARINQNYLGLKNFARAEIIGQNMGALGVQIAHSGYVVGLMFPPGGSHSPEARRGIDALRRELGIKTFWRFRTGKNSNPQALSIKWMNEPATEPFMCPAGPRLSP
jgi:uncharacterized protein involved in propanediol utilization